MSHARKGGDGLGEKIMGGYILDRFALDFAAWRIVIVAFCIATCVYPPRHRTVRHDLPRFLLCWACCAAAGAALRALFGVIVYAAGGSAYLEILLDFLSLLVVFTSAMAVSGRARSFMQLVVCPSFVAAYTVTEGLYATLGAYVAARAEGFPGAVLLLVYALLLAYSVVYGLFPLDSQTISRGGVALLSVMDVATIIYSVAVGEMYLMTGVADRGMELDVFHFTAFAMLYLMVAVVYVSLYFICRERDAHARAVRETDMLRSTGDLRKLTDASMAQIRQARHDLKNQISYMNVLLENGNLDELGKTLRSLSESSAASQPYIDCGNVEISSILTMESVKARSHGFALEPLIVVPATLPFEGSDLCALISNMCDNAIESNLRHGIGDPVEVRVCLRGEYMHVGVSNTLPEGVDGETVLSLETSKRDRREHGIGTAVIKNTAEKYEGYANFDVRGGRFVAEAELYMGASAAGEEKEKEDMT